MEGHEQISHFNQSPKAVESWFSVMYFFYIDCIAIAIDIANWEFIIVMVFINHNTYTIKY